jgi:hypothetical protein
MKYVVSWTIRPGGSAEERVQLGDELLAAFGRWTPPATETFHQFLGRLDGQGGVAVVETDNPADVLQGPAFFGSWLEFSIVPVVDIAESVAVLAEGSRFRAGG